MKNNIPTIILPEPLLLSSYVDNKYLMYYSSESKLSILHAVKKSVWSSTLLSLSLSLPLSLPSSSDAAAAPSAASAAAFASIPVDVDDDDVDVAASLTLLKVHNFLIKYISRRPICVHGDASRSIVADPKLFVTRSLIATDI